CGSGVEISLEGKYRSIFAHRDANLHRVLAALDVEVVIQAPAESAVVHAHRRVGTGIKILTLSKDTSRGVSFGHNTAVQNPMNSEIQQPAKPWRTTECSRLQYDV